MRSTSVVWFLVLGLMIAAASPAAAQDQVTQDSTEQARAAAAAPVLPDVDAKLERPDVGPRLPEVVASIPLPVVAPAAAVPKNIVIPVTTLTIVLAVVLLIVLID